MDEKLRTYHIVSNWFDGGWQTQTDTMEDTTLRAAWTAASERAKQLDTEYGDTHHWNVFVRNPEGNDYVELFHGRLI
jgi:hypothetical protein